MLYLIQTEVYGSSFAVNHFLGILSLPTVIRLETFGGR